MSRANTHNKILIKDVLVNPEAFATTLVMVLVDYYGIELVEWAPETVRMQTEEDFSMTWPSINFDRLMAGIALVKSNYFYKSLPDFIELCNILSGSAANPTVFDPADAAECAWGITEALLLSPPDEDEPFTEEIRAYIGKMCELEGIITPPDILKIGINDRDFKIHVHNTFSDDPEMYSAIWDVEAGKTSEINELVKDRLTALVMQLNALQLVNGDTSTVATQMLQHLKTKPSDGSPL